jgi:hypothetical protein
MSLFKQIREMLDNQNVEDSESIKLGVPRVLIPSVC